MTQLHIVRLPVAFETIKFTANWQCSGRAHPVHFVTSRFRHFLEALVRMTPAAFPEKQAVPQSGLQHFTTAYKMQL